MEQLDVIVIGAGQAGGPLAKAFAQAGRSVALVERALVGGTCINYGCTPTKTMIASARAAHMARRAGDYGVRLAGDDGRDEVHVDLSRVRDRKRTVVASFRDSGERGLERAGVRLVRGHARFTGPRELAVDDGPPSLHADIVVINTGQRPAIPDLEGLDAVPYLTSTTIMELAEVPRHLVVLGGGYIGVEFAQMFRRFGSEVTVLQRGAQLLPHEDEDIAGAVADILRDEGIAVRCDVEATGVERAGDDGVRVRWSGADGPGSTRGSHLLVATGRRSNTDDLGLDAAGVATDDRGNVRADARLATNVPGIYVLGDAKGGPAFTHISYDDYRILKANLLDGAEMTVEGRIVPYTVFTDPQLGAVGMTEREAREAGHDVKVARLPMTHVARAIETDETRGVMKAVIDASTDRILGARILGIEGGEIATLLQVAMLGDLPYTVLRDSAFSHPTVAESLNNLFMAVEDDD